MKKLLITIDGPAGAGKTTVSRQLAERLEYTYIDTGALYRAVAHEAHSKGIAADDDAGLEQLCRGLEIAFVRQESGLSLMCNGVDITDLIRSPEITMLASAVSARPVVRQFLLGLQREMGQQKGVVFEGRDMGTVVFPEADVKFFLSASADTRALRRYKEMGAKTATTLEEVSADINRRDQNDSTRELAPLKPAEDAIRIDSTDLSIPEVVDLMISNIRNQ
ncbi:MAG: (d)CMP kinase [Deltaproteobacteria bacterium]|jgi:cytidylate kinase|nr:(d)CMP kinase [Deltaproteobacteria bacterium]